MSHLPQSLAAAARAPCMRVGSEGMERGAAADARSELEDGGRDTCGPHLHA